MNKFRLLLLNCAEIVPTPPLPWPSSQRHIFLRKQPEKFGVLQSTLSAFWPEAIQRSAVARRYEYSLGRLGAATLLSDMGQKEADQWIGQEGRRPIWPSGIVGSISHSEELVVVTAGHSEDACFSLGIDVERLERDPKIVEPLRLCFNEREMIHLKCVPYGWLTGFSAKEALFKCLSEEVGRYFDFRDVEIVRVDAENQKLVLRLLVSLSPRLQAGMEVVGFYRQFDGHVWSGVIWSKHS